MAKKRSDTKHVRLDEYLFECPAYRALSVGARGLYSELRFKYNGFGNGALGFGYREAASRLNCHLNTVGRYFEDLQRKGFIVAKYKATFHISKGNRTTEWELTEYGIERAHGPRKLYMEWKSSADDFPVARQDMRTGSFRKSWDTKTVTNSHRNSDRKIDTDTKTVTDSHKNYDREAQFDGETGHKNCDTYNLPEGTPCTRTDHSGIHQSKKALVLVELQKGWQGTQKELAEKYAVDPGYVSRLKKQLIAEKENHEQITKNQRT